MTDQRENPQAPIVAVGVVVVRGSDVLLIKRAKPPSAGAWSLPGGAVDLSETTRDAGRREVFEETGLDVEPAALLDVIDFIDREDDGTARYHYVLIDYVALHRGGEPVAGSDAADARFFSLEEALAMPLWSETKRILTLAVETAMKERDPDAA